MSSSANLYALGAGTVSSNIFTGNAFVSDRNPTSSDTIGPNGPWKPSQLWLNSATESLYFLGSVTASAGVIEANWVLIDAASGNLNTLTGNTGGAIGPDGGGNIDIVGSGAISVAGSGNTLTISDSSAAAVETLSGDTGTATPSSGNIQIATGSNLTSTASGSTVTISVDGDVATLFAGDSGTTAPVSNIITLHGQGSILTGAGSPAGTVNIRGDGVSTVNGNTGSATPPVFPAVGANQISIVGSGSITTSGSGATLTITSTAPTFNTWVTTTSATYTLAAGNNLTYNAVSGVITLPNIVTDAALVVGSYTKILAITSVAVQGVKIQVAAAADGIIFAPSTSDFENVTSTTTGAAIELIVVSKTGSNGLWQVASSTGSWTGGT